MSQISYSIDQEVFNQFPGISASCGILYVTGYYNKLPDFMDHVTLGGFMSAAIRSLLLAAEESVDLLDLFENYRLPHEDRTQWIKDQSGS